MESKKNSDLREFSFILEICHRCLGEENISTGHVQYLVVVNSVQQTSLEYC